MSTLAHELDRYLAIRRSLGFDLSTAARVLRRFVAFARSKGVDHVTTDLFLGWKNAFGEASSQTWAARLVMVRQFAQWLSGIDPRNEVPPKALVPGRYRRSRPYIYSDREIAQIIDGGGAASFGQWHPCTDIRGALWSHCRDRPSDQRGNRPG